MGICLTDFTLKYGYLVAVTIETSLSSPNCGIAWLDRGDRGSLILCVNRSVRSDKLLPKKLAILFMASPRRSDKQNQYLTVM